MLNRIRHGTQLDSQADDRLLLLFRFRPILTRNAVEGQGVSAPEDTPYCGLITLEIDATDTVRGIVRGRQSVPVAEAGAMTLLYPKWMPGYHSPQNPIELFAGLEIRAADTLLDWRRDPVEVYAFHIDVPDGADALDIRFQFLSPTTSSQGDVVVIEDLVNLQCGRMVLYPAGYYSRRIQVQASVTLPEGWVFSTVLQAARRDGAHPSLRADPARRSGRFAAHGGAPHAARSPLAEGGAVRLDLFAHDAADLDMSDEQIGLHAALVAQADTLFASRHFDRYRFLVALSDELGGGGVEHHRSAEIVVPPNYFRAWDGQLPEAGRLRPRVHPLLERQVPARANSWTPSFELPIRNSLMWVYEGQTQYWGHVLTARAGLWSTRERAARRSPRRPRPTTCDPAALWRTMADTTEDPIINGRAAAAVAELAAERGLLCRGSAALARDRHADPRTVRRPAVARRFRPRLLRHGRRIDAHAAPIRSMTSSRP